jgi:phospholipid/cholesterol/gamma-HCH transport system substrate-binding protein
MPRTRSIAWSELKVGLIGLVAVGLAIAMVFAVGGTSGFWWQRYPLRVKFPNAEGLKPGAVVRLSGKDVGMVKAVDFAGPEIDVSVELLEDVRPLVTTDSTADIGSLGLLGEPIISVKASATGTPLPDHAYIRAAPAGGSIDALTETASTSLNQIQGLLADVRAGKGTLGKLVTDDALYAELQAFVSSANAVTTSLRQGRGTLGGLINDPAAYDSLKTSLANLQAITARINSGQGALGRFLTDDRLGQSISASVGNVEEMTGRLNRGEGTAGKLLTDRQLYDRLNSMADRVDQVVAGLNDGRGTAGRLLHDQELYENMNRAIGELRDLLAAVRQDPQKYLRVRVSIF